MIAGMLIEIVSDEGDKWQTRNLTTNESLLFDKSVLEKAVKLGKAEEIPGEPGNKKTGEET